MGNNNNLFEKNNEEREKLLRESEARVEEERRNYAGPHCCMTMHYGLIDGSNVLHYRKKFREYGVAIPRLTTYMLVNYCDRMIMDFCAFCGKKLPYSLRNEWFDILEEKYGLKYPFGKDKYLIPKEFITDKWWKKLDVQSYLPSIEKEINIQNIKYTGPHCCMAMYHGLIDKKKTLHYSKKFREYGVNMAKSTGCMLMDHCIFCGKKLPNELSDEWIAVLRKEYGLSDPWEKNAQLIPQEFLTDEWWRKRGL
jgi:hypothetical protein